MYRLLLALLPVLLVCTLTSCAPRPTPEQPLEGEVVDAGRDYVARLAARDFEGADKLHDANMRRELAGNKLAGLWKDISQQFGAYQELVSAHPQKVG